MSPSIFITVKQPTISSIFSPQSSEELIIWPAASLTTHQHQSGLGDVAENWSLLRVP